MRVTDFQHYVLTWFMFRKGFQNGDGVGNKAVKTRDKWLAMHIRSTISYIYWLADGIEGSAVFRKMFLLCIHS